MTAPLGALASRTDACAGASSRSGLSALERVECLCDRGSTRVIRSAVISPRMGARAAPGDGVVAASGAIDGRGMFCFSQDGRYAGGSLGEAQAETIARTLALARRAGVPFIGLVDSAGARLQEGTAALAGYGRIFREHVAASGRIPQISVVNGVAAGGGCYGPALTDFTIMSGDATMFLTGPRIVRGATGERVRAADLGGAATHARNGVCHLVASDDADAARLARDLLSYLPQNATQSPPAVAAHPAPGGDPAELVPGETRRVYDVRDVIRRLVDGGVLLELSPRWARNMITAFARLDGRSVAIVANQPRHVGGVIDTDAAEKAARFVRTCDAFGVPLAVLVDTPGFLPGSAQEQRGIIRYGAELVRAFASATVPRVSVVLRQAYGGAYITMNSKALGADFAFAWPGARIGIMGAHEAVGIVHRRALETGADDPGHRRRLSERYAVEEQDAAASARGGFVDEIISPSQTRDRLALALDVLAKTRQGPRTTGDAWRDT